MVVIRLARGGAKNRPFFNVVVADSRDPRDGRFVERIGYYDPKAKTEAATLRIDMQRFGYWKGCGAIPSPTVARLAKRAAKAAVPAA